MMPKPGERITWSRLTEPEFTRLMEALVTAHHASEPDSLVTPIDGRGGDGGVDTLLQKAGGHTRVYQFKHFPDGFDGKHGARRVQIKKSLETAKKKVPEMQEWLLAYPGTPTRPGTVFLKNLREENPDITIMVWHRSDLDVISGQHLSTVDAVLREEEYFLDNMKALNVEHAVLGSSSALVDRLTRLAKVTDEVSPDWALDFMKNAQETTTILRAKHPQAQTKSPITMQLEIDPEVDESVWKQLRSTLGFGAAGSVTVPGTMVSEFKVEGPEWLQVPQKLDGLTVTVPGHAAPAGATKVRVRLMHGSHPSGSWVGKIQTWGHGDQGMSLNVQVAENMLLQFLINTAEYSNRGGLNVTVDLTDPTVRQARETARFLTKMHGSDGFELEVVGHGLLASAEGLTCDIQDDYIDALVALEETCSDLLAIGELIDTEFCFPVELSTWERIKIRSLRLMLEGRWVAAGRAPATATFTLDHVPSDAHHDQVRLLFAGQPGAIRVQQEDSVAQICDQQVDVGTQVLWHPSMRLRLPDGGKAVVGEKYVMEATDGTPFRRALRESVVKPECTQVVPWGLQRIAEAGIADDGQSDLVE